MPKEYRIDEGSINERYHASRYKVQFAAGGFGNGKTSAMCIKALGLVRDYPGCYGILARATYPKLRDTVIPEFFKWCPPRWIERYKEATHDVYFKNGSRLSFRYVAQKGKQQDDGSTTSNLLSANLDFVGVDQLEDPEITYKDFTDLLGRLRGTTPYRGNDPTMPRSGPRWFLGSCNPTRNWVYRKLVKPYHIWRKTGNVVQDLLYDVETKQPIIDLFESSTYENAANLPPDYLRGLEATYKGQMRDRFLLGQWAAYEGLVYPMFDMDVHVIQHDVLDAYLMGMYDKGFQLIPLEAYDYGMASPSCYMYAFVDPFGNVFVMDGFYERELSVRAAAKLMKEHRQNYIGASKDFRADPSIFKRSTGSAAVVGQTVAGLFNDEGIVMQRGDNSITHGITKVSSYLNVQEGHRHPIHGVYGSPYIFFSSKLTWFVDEITDYYWQKDEQGEWIDKPRDHKDHAMDTLKYLLSSRPDLARILVRATGLPAHLRRWTEKDVETVARQKAHRYG